MSGRKIRKRKRNGDSDENVMTNREGKPGLDKELQVHIGHLLKSMYDGYLTEPLPKRISELIGKLDEVSRGDGSGRKEDADK